MSLFGSEHWMYSSGGGGFYGTEINGSLRLEDADNAYLSRAQSAGNRRTFTWSGWVKRTDITSQRSSLFSAGRTDTTSGNDPHLTIWDDDYIRWEGDGGGFRKEWSMKFRDPSAWYHIVLRIDSTQADANNRVRLYVNGEIQTDTRNNSVLGQNAEYGVNQSGKSAFIGAQNDGGSAVVHSDFYIAEVNFVDGQSLDATSFGETKSGVWIPKAYSGSYGTNGFHLEFAGNANDSSGNGNNWTANNINSYDYVPDSPTNNFATLNPIHTNQPSAQITWSQGNLYIDSSGGSAANHHTFSTIGPKTGKWYFEVRIPSDSDQMVSVISESNTTGMYSAGYPGQNANSGVSYYEYGDVYYNGSTDSGIPAYGAGDIIQCAFDVDNQYVWFGKNNTWYGTVNTSSGRFSIGGQSGDSVFAVAAYRGPEVFNFGQDSTFVGGTTSGGNSDDNGYGDFKYAPPSGYLALCTANLSVAEGVDPALDASPQDHFSAVTYSGTDSAQNITVGFQPDFVWLKRRDAAANHALFDSVRGAYKELFSNTAAAEYTEPTGTNLTGFLSNGFSLGTNGQEATVQGAGRTFISWNWKGAGSASTNTDGSNTTTVSANPDAGISIVTGTKTGGATTANTFGHGLGKKPQFIMQKRRDGSEDWYGYFEPLTAYYRMGFNTTSGQVSTNVWHDTEPTDSVFTIRSFNDGDFVAYCFTSIEGFSSIGKYIGNGSADGPFVYTGFRPAFVMIKNASTSAPWQVLDSARKPYNTGLGYYQLRPNENSSESSSGQYSVDILSNGFKDRTGASTNWNTSGQTYIYMAFAENPFKYANAR